MSERDPGGKSDAASSEEGGEQQEPKQAEEDSSSFWDTQQHSDAPGPFGTGEDMTESTAASDDPDESGRESDAGDG